MKDLSKFLQSYYETLEIFKYGFLFIYSDLRGFAGAIADSMGPVDRNALCEAVVSPFLERGMITLVVPTFAYVTEGTFDVHNPPTRLGALNKWVLTQKEVRCSEHPLFSFAALGPQSQIVEGVGKSAFGYESVFYRLHSRHTGVLHFGPLETGSTHLHYVEQLCGATYRIHKAFQTKVYRSEKYVGTDYSAFLRRRDVSGFDFAATCEREAAVLRDQGLVFEVSDPGNLYSLSAYDYGRSIDVLTALFYQDPSAFIDGEFVQY